MPEDILISICVPTYKRVHYLQRLFTSLEAQTFKAFEIIITDNSPDEEVKVLAAAYSDRLPITYYKNDPPVGATANWNAAMSKARCKWVKIMHDDDWFTTPTALQQFYDATLAHPDCDFFFSAFQNVVEGTKEIYPVRCDSTDLAILKMNTLHLLKRVYVGNPSCTMMKYDPAVVYDEDYIFVVDCEYYIRYINKHKKYHYIDEVLLNVGFHQEQLTKYTFRKPEVQLPENHLLFRKMGAGILNNVLVYDYFWRLYRNMDIRSVADAAKYDKKELPEPLRKIIQFQSRVPAGVLRNGIGSKLFMGLSYLRSLIGGH